jgi:hypothetical protein
VSRPARQRSRDLLTVVLSFFVTLLVSFHCIPFSFPIYSHTQQGVSGELPYPASPGKLAEEDCSCIVVQGWHPMLESHRRAKIRGPMMHRGSKQANQRAKTPGQLHPGRYGPMSRNLRTGRSTARASNQRGRTSAKLSDTICQTDSPQGILRSLCRHTTPDCPPSGAVIHALCFSNDCNLSHTRPDCPPSDDFVHALYFTDGCNLSLEVRKASASRSIDKYRDSTQTV